MYAIKEAVIAKEHAAGDLDCAIFNTPLWLLDNMVVCPAAVGVSIEFSCQDPGVLKTAGTALIKFIGRITKHVTQSLA